MVNSFCPGNQGRYTAAGIHLKQAAKLSTNRGHLRLPSRNSANPSCRNHPIGPLTVNPRRSIKGHIGFSDFRVIHNETDPVGSWLDLNVGADACISQFMKRGNCKIASRTPQIMVFICDKVRRNETRRVISIQYLDSNFVYKVKQEHPRQQFASSCARQQFLVDVIESLVTGLGGFCTRHVQYRPKPFICMNRRSQIKDPCVASIRSYFKLFHRP